MADGWWVEIDPEREVETPDTRQFPDQKSDETKERKLFHGGRFSGQETPSPLFDPHALLAP